MAEPLDNLSNYFEDFKHDTEASYETVFHCASKLTIYLGETKVYNDGRCMLTSNHMVWRNLAHSASKRQRILFNLKHIRAITIKSSRKLSAFTAARLLIFVNELQPNNASNTSPHSQYIQLSFKNGADARNLFAKKLQTIIANKTIDDGKNNDEDNDKYETLQNIIISENIIDEIHENYVKITVSEFASAVQTLYYIQGYSSTQNAVKYNNLKSASEIITKLVKYDNATHHLKLSTADTNAICDTYFNYEPYLEISSPKQINASNSYTSYHCNRFVDLNLYIFRLFSQIYPIKCALATQEKWIETVLGCTWYMELDDESENKIIGLIDMLINKIWNVKFIPMDNINFNNKYNLFIIKHILSNYLHPENIPIDCHFQALTQTFLIKSAESKKYHNYGKYLIDILNISALKTRFSAQIVHGVMVELVTKSRFGQSNYVILELIKYIKANIDVNDKNGNGFLDLQCYLRGVIDEDESLKIIELNLMINSKLIYLKWKGKYNGLNAIEYAKSKQVKPNQIIQFLENKMETFDEYNQLEDDEKFMVQTDKIMQETEKNDYDLCKVIEMISDLQTDINDLKVIIVNKEQGDGDENKEIIDIDVDRVLQEKCNKELVVNKDWRNWSYFEIVEYFVGLEDGKFEKYKNTLFKKMKYREIKGIDFLVMEKTDLSNFFGVVNYGDLCSLWNHIQTLTQT